MRFYLTVPKINLAHMLSRMYSYQLDMAKLLKLTKPHFLICKVGIIIQACLKVCCEN
jgi:hypothetical protein